ncbi:hypothetical protein RhiirC2_792696 [Rhizophagus irregularis]|uniref:Uncharacterized protein n=1 Tax=Rhizophagus irregularis TaxID=588596 RepID=A0A2N1MGU4_9GLOM|nr:hypothetical protein RhiirC2_792696 [Rhizophagus irregularis]
MEPTFSKTKKGWGGERKYYKEYHSFRADANRTQQQIKRWNRLKFLNFKSWRSLGQVQSFLINEHSHIYKKIQHGVERICDYTKDTWKIKRNKNIRKRAKNWQRRTKMPLTPYNEWKGKKDFYLQNAMEPTFSKMKKGWGGERKYYKEYHSFRADANRTQQQIKWWNHLKFSNFKSWRSLGQVQPFLINEHSHIYKKIQHGVKCICDYTKDTWEIKRNKNIHNFTGKASTYYFNTHNINLYAYKVRRRFDLSGIPEFNHGYLKAKRCYLNHQKVLLSRQPPIVEDKIIETNEYNQATFFSDKLIMDFHRAHFTPTTSSPQQYPSMPEPDLFQSIKDGDERPIWQPRKRRTNLPPTPGPDQ